ncbi:hypothetical protein [Mycobacteroides abscessus]|uniref:hypothetical protein n=1 Tax=Mycobacteroides abscessus TaxID=36809 RepID=UPI001F1613C2|nr:hypothetical protein [Mycobacteroides abscessus]MDM2174947.1 hypothetical protein [Mycobacteroides abscessus]MDM2208054.1 hypothetical protein [Mycobacteroides abscessus]MDM2214665.1 hypothetical protein [Mycobacteroides abscessus]MDM2219659.1 hypothetical protein [Mycobacteroides abscessus]MDM2223930.1 hypothetical protein [Mycobacteroides abscessus]
MRESQWKPPVHWTKQVQSLEQDQAAGGRDYRKVKADPRALARVVLRRQHRRIYAALRWQADKELHSHYLGEVTEDTRKENLRAGWRRARREGLTPGNAAELR